jgi:hypothetical protein
MDLKKYNFVQKHVKNVHHDNNFAFFRKNRLTLLEGVALIGC